MSNPFALAYTSLEKEIQVEKLPVEGIIPTWLYGSLLRNGPAKFEVGSEQVWHWFDGLAMLHRFSFQNGNVSYANKFVRSEAYTTATQENCLTYAMFAADPCRKLFRHAMTGMINPNVSIQRVAGEFLAMTEAPLPIAFDPRTLETLGVVHYDDQVSGHYGSAHPHHDFAGEMTISYLTEFGMQSTVKVFSTADRDGRRRELIGAYPTLEPSYIHSFSITEHYIVLVEYPFRVVPLELLSEQKAFIQYFTWRPQEPTLFIVMSRQDGSIAGKYESEAFFSFHHINAFERAGEIVLDLSAYPDAVIIEETNLSNLRDGTGTGKRSAHSEFRRYRLPLSVSSAIATYERISEQEIELPTINYTHSNTHDYGVAYGVSTAQEGAVTLAHQLVRTSTRTSATKTWAQDGCYPGEPVFAQAPEARGEDDGVVLSVVLNAYKDNSFLLVLDAHTFEELGRAEVPHHIPLGLHGQYFPGL
ncbi:MAG TPA: carotenoid oxygenase family protein [Ktedonobacteraceae bacterium]|jgi:beta,beta-carotene 9',10'-dioxygenase|nr:carotenoid oxygenase family protein [Ktedonobacteraceae bacterium]